MISDRHYATTLDTRFGKLNLVATDIGLRALTWPVDSRSRVPVPEDVIDDGDHPVLVAARVQLEEYLAGERTQFEIELDLRGTDFQKKVWRALADIPYGSTATYGEQAKRVGSPKAARAIGSANRRNPISIILPCHRVIGSTGELVGFAGGIDTKRDLLAFEQSRAD